MPTDRMTNVWGDPAYQDITAELLNELERLQIAVGDTAFPGAHG